MLNIECNQEWSRNMELLMCSGRDTYYIYNEFVNVYGNMFNNYVIQSNKKCNLKRK